MTAMSGILMLTYPFWGAFLFLAFCVGMGCFGRGSHFARIGWATLIALLATAIFAPGGLGTTGFGFIVPWYLAYYVGKQYGLLSWESFVMTFGVAFVLAVIVALAANRERVKN